MVCIYIERESAHARKHRKKYIIYKIKVKILTLININF